MFHFVFAVIRTTATQIDSAVWGIWILVEGIFSARLLQKVTRHFVIDDNILSLYDKFVIDDRKLQTFDIRGHSGGQIQVFQ